MSRDRVPAATMGRTCAVVLLGALQGCARGPAMDLDALPAGWPVPQPAAAVASLEVSETYSVELEDRLFVHAAAVVAGEADAWDRLLTEDFQGSSWIGGEVADVELDWGARETVRLPGEQVTDRAAFLAALDARLGSWERVDWARWEMPRAAYEAARPVWATVELIFEARGRGAGGEVHALRLLGRGQAVKLGERWSLRSLDLGEVVETDRAAPYFTDVTTAAGLAYRGLDLDELRARGVRPQRQPFNGAAAGDVDGDGAWDLFVAGKTRDMLYLGDGRGGFREASAEWGLEGAADGSGAAFLDYDNDGDQDLFVASEGYVDRDGSVRGQPLRLYRNDGDRMVEVGEELGIRAHMSGQSVVVFDYDGDGWLDIFLTNYGDRRTEDVDSWTDGANGQRDALWRNQEGRGFVDVAVEAGLDQSRWSYAAAAADFDRDGDQDLYIAHDYAVNAFYRNRGDGTFEEVGAELAAEDLGFGMGVNWADLDNDGRLDLYVANMEVPAARRVMAHLGEDDPRREEPLKLMRGNTILLQQEDGRFGLAPESYGGIRGLWAWACAVVDFDLDGRIDVFCTNGMFTRDGIGDIHSLFWRNVVAATLDPGTNPGMGMSAPANSDAFRASRVREGRAGRSWGGHEPDRFWLNQGASGFRDLSVVSGLDSAGDGRAAVPFDMDDDGDLDLFVNEWSFRDQNRQFLFRNDIAPSPSGFLKLRLRATSGQWQAFGAEVQIETSAGPCSQVLANGNGFLSATPPELVFGLGAVDATDVTVRWPGGRVESFGRLPAGARMLLVEGSGEAVPYSPPTSDD